jgi:hypothetical protein
MKWGRGLGRGGAFFFVITGCLQLGIQNLAIFHLGLTLLKRFLKSDFAVLCSILSQTRRHNGRRLCLGERDQPQRVASNRGILV